MYDYEKLFSDYGVEYRPMNSRGFITVNCPLCMADNDFHGGVNIEDDFYVCWRCGTVSIGDIINKLTGENWWRIRNKYEINSILPVSHEKPKLIPPSSVSLPPGQGLDETQRRYLEIRNFNPEELIQKYGVYGTGPIGEHNFRIIAPIYFKGELISYIGRDYTNSSGLRYRACKAEEELYHYKHILYNIDNCPGNSIVIVEGITDVWRLGDGAAATFGTGFTKQQQNLVADRFKKVALIYDSEPQATIKASLLAGNLAGMGLDVDLVFLEEGDPGDLPQEAANKLMKDLERE